MTLDPVEFGRYAAKVEMLGQDVASMRTEMASANAKLDSVLVTLAERRGERRMVGWVAAAAGTVVSIIVALVSRMMER